MKGLPQNQRIVWWLSTSLVMLIILGLGITMAVGYSRMHRQFEAEETLWRASSDSLVIARGNYLVHGPGRCADCHGGEKQRDALRAGQEVTLEGGHATVTYLGTFYSPNITSDSLTGIGAISDGKLGRFFTTGINHQNEVGLPLMEYFQLADADIVAILSYLRSVPPIVNQVPRDDWNFLGVLTKAFFLAPEKSRKLAIQNEPDTSLAYGEYLATTLANCRSCHTARNMKTGEYTGAFFAGGLEFKKSNDPTIQLRSPNLTPDSGSGRLQGWTEEQFIARFRLGALLPWSPMPWGPYQRMHENDLRALYHFLKSLKPVCYACLPTQEN